MLKSSRSKCNLTQTVVYIKLKTALDKMCLTVDHHTNFVLMFNQLLCFCGQFFWSNICDLHLYFSESSKGWVSFSPLTVKTTYDVINRSLHELNQADPPNTSHLVAEQLGHILLCPLLSFELLKVNIYTNQRLRLHLRCLGSSFLMYSSSIGMEQRAAADICSFIGVMPYRYS